MINVVQHGDEYHITFPFDYRIKDLVKGVFGRKWHPEGKYWSIPNSSLGYFINQFKGTEFEDMVSIRSNEQINVNETLDDTQTIPDIKLGRTKLYVKDGSKLYSHQKDFMKFAMNREKNEKNLNGFLLADTMGLGKSLESINLALYNKRTYSYKHCLVLCCVNSSKYNWHDEIETQTNGEFEGYILGTRIQKRTRKENFTGSSKNKLEDLKEGHKYGDKKADKLPYFIILNVEALRYKEGRKYEIADQLISLINSGWLNMIIIDEVHKNLSPTSQQGKQILRIKKNAKKPCMFLPMTGTPIVNRPTDLFVPLRLVNAHKVDSYYKWNRNFCVFGGFGGHDIIGYKNMKPLKHLLSKNMLRRTKEDTLDLPEKIELIEYVENSPYQRRLATQVTTDIENHRDSIMASPNPLSKMLRLRQVNGSPELVDLDLKFDKSYLSKNAKLKRLLEIVDDIIDRDEKVIIFSNWVEPLRTIYRYLRPKHKVCCFTGTMNEKDRQLHKQTFIENPEYKIIIGTIGALGTTHTLTVANNVIFYDEPWSSADRQQAIDRAHRIGTTKNVNVYTLISKDTIDERVHKILYTKDMTSKFIVDGKLDIKNNPELFDMLLGRG